MTRQVQILNKTLTENNVKLLAAASNAKVKVKYCMKYCTSLH